MLNEVKHLAYEKEVCSARERSPACGTQILRCTQDDRVCAGHYHPGVYGLPQKSAANPNFGPDW
jgi:hypothetical protein